jgi:hypothetical protein
VHPLHRPPVDASRHTVSGTLPCEMHATIMLTSPVGQCMSDDLESAVDETNERMQNMFTPTQAAPLKVAA